MTDADIDLIRAAGKAAGLTLQLALGFTERDRGLFTADGKEWNPLADDGDALRLMASLRIDTTFKAFGEDEVMTSDSEDRFDGWFSEAYAHDTAAATRRAIVRAAAEIGKAAAPSGA